MSLKNKMSNFVSPTTHSGPSGPHLSYNNHLSFNFQPPVPRDPIPTVFDFGQLQQTYTELEKNLANALTTIPQKVKNISNDQNTQIRDLNSEIKTLRQDLLAIQLEYSEQSSNLDILLSELEDKGKNKVDELERQRQEAQLINSQGETRLRELGEEHRALTGKLKTLQDQLNGEMRRGIPELSRYERYLGIRIEVLDMTLMRFMFINIDSDDYNREFWIELGIGGSEYSVGDSTPDLGDDVKKYLQDEFNGHQKFVKFLVTTRKLFKRSIEKV